MVAAVDIAEAAAAAVAAEAVPDADKSKDTDKKTGGQTVTYFYAPLCLENERFDELFPIEALQVGHLFAQTDVFDRNLELVGYTEHHSTLGCSVKFGDSQRTDLRSSRELPRLLKSILTG